MAAIEKLTDKAIQSAIKTVSKTGAAKTISDGGGLSLQVQPSGKGWWRLRYWMASRENRLSLGTYPTVLLATARKRRRDSLKLIAEDIDPSEQRKERKALAAAKAAAAKFVAETGAAPGSFKAVAAEWLKTVHEVKSAPATPNARAFASSKTCFPGLATDRSARLTRPNC